MITNKGTTIVIDSIVYNIDGKIVSVIGCKSKNDVIIPNHCCPV